MVASRNRLASIRGIKGIERCNIILFCLKQG